MQEDSEKWGMSMVKNHLLSGVAAVVIATSLGTASAKAQSLSNWDWNWEIYGWLPDIEGETQLGADLDLPISDILDNLDFTFQTTLSASRENWTLFGDLVYLGLGASNRIAPDVKAKVDMESIISTSGVGYKLFENAQTTLKGIGGVRYTYLDVKVKVTTPRNLRFNVDESEHFWDGVIGLQGTTRLNDKWSILYYADVGTGDSDLTWQASLGVSYAFEKFDVTLRYRYLDYEFDSDAPLDNMNVSGPQIGIRFQF